MTVQQDLASYFTSQAEWREGRAYAYPEDDRNERAGESLRSLATYTANLPDTDLRIQVVSTLLQVWPSDVIEFHGLEGAVERPTYPASRIGFDHPRSQHGLRTQVDSIIDDDEELTRYVLLNVGEATEDLVEELVNTTWLDEFQDAVERLSEAHSKERAFGKELDGVRDLRDLGQL